MKTNTKTKLLMLLLLSGGMTMQAQDYVPVVQEGNEWHTFNVGAHNRIGNYDIWCAEDTIVDGLKYTKLMAEAKTLDNNYYFSGLWFLLREENEKVWKRQLNNPDEILLYDFTASVGDTLTIGDFGQRLIVDSIGTVQIGNADRKKFWLRLKSDNPGGHQFVETWVEGIGSDYGLLWSGYLAIPDGWYCLLCFHQNGELVWQNPDYPECTFNGVFNEIEENDDFGITVYPNPAKDRIVIKGVEACSVQVYNTLGQMVKQMEGTNEISVAGMPEGVYLLKVTTANGTSREVRVAVKR